MQQGTLYLHRLRQLLQLEYENEKEEFRIQTEKMGINRKVRRGLCWYPVTAGRSYYNSLNQLVVEITNDIDSEEEIEHNFEYGRPVQFFSFNAKYIDDKLKDKNDIKYYPFASTVSFVDGNRMVVTVPSSQALIDIQNAENLGVQLFFDETSYKTMFHAMDDVVNAKKNRLADLRDIFGGQIKAEKRTFAPMSFPWLNRTQEQAVNEVLWAKDVAIVHGPPGTGKTTTLVEAIYETLRRETQVMVCAQSNMAVDWISEKLVDHGISVLRIGNPTRVNDKMLSFTYERKFESHPDYPELWSIRKTIREIREHRKKGDNVHQKIARLRERAQEIEMRINASLFDEARVVACTLVGSANKILVGQKFSTLFIDEAAQALEPACWIAIRRASRVVFAGDHQQLPPTIKCFDAMKQGLSKTLMERIVENQPTAVSLLKVQYRMNDEIMKFSSDWFYNGQVESDKSVQHRGILDYDTPMLWISTSEDLEAKEEFVGENHGRINKPEAELTVNTLKEYIEKIGVRRYIDERLDVGIISPYRLQTQYIRQLIKKDAFFRQIRNTISVNTVDGFQGQERDIIMISLVRSNDQGQIGFLNDLRRMNVAITRARMKLIIIGNAETLSHHSFYKKLYKYVMSLQEPSALTNNSKTTTSKMTYEETISYLFNSAPLFQNVGAGAYKEGLYNTHYLDEFFGHPHEKFKSIHVAGTNGKGSTSHTLAAILQSAGLKVGLFTSPHLVDFRERIRVNGEMIEEEYVIDFVEQYRNVFEPLHPSFFELTTAMAFKYFAEKEIDVAVVEVGLGGRLDCTNIITPVVSVITNISFDHVGFLGDTLAKIAGEKAGIIKKGVPVVIGEYNEETRPVFEAKAQEMEAPICFAEDENIISNYKFCDEGGIDYETVFGNLHGELGGACQVKNTATVLCAIGIFRQKVASEHLIHNNDIEYGFANVCETTGLMGRWQTIQTEPKVVCDTGHNIGGFEYISKQIASQPCKQLRIVMGMVSDKDINGVLSMLPKNAIYYFTQASVKRARNCEEVEQLANQHGLYGKSFPNVIDAYKTALSEADKEDFIYVGGSSFIVADLLTSLKK